jgi:polyphosphate kinase
MRASRKTFMSIYAKIFSEMEEQGIRIVDEKSLDEEQKEFCRNYYAAVVSPRISPLILKRSTKIPFLRGRNIYHAVKMCSAHSARGT